VIEQGDNDIDMIDLPQIKSMKPKNATASVYGLKERKAFTVKVLVLL
jgi:hypothetical protein